MGLEDIRHPGEQICKTCIRVGCSDRGVMTSNTRDADFGMGEKERLELLKEKKIENKIN